MKLARYSHEGQCLSIEYAELGDHDQQAPLVLFLHEGLGSLAMWRDFPDLLCREAGWRGLVYSRPAYGQSKASELEASWDPQFMHDRAREIDGLLASIGETLDRPVWLFGHSDGASIALIYASLRPERVAGLILMAPHLFVEPITLTSIRAAVASFPAIRPRLARYHDDVDAAFTLWSGAWLHPSFEAWSIEQDIAGVAVPILAIQGQDDEYGTMAQLDRLQALCPQADLLKLADCRHSPHRDQTSSVIQAAIAFVSRIESEQQGADAGARRAS